MSRKTSVQKNGSPKQEPEGITQITVGGYKSISREQTIEIRPLTILAGANSSGKSSIMQPLLMLKQTLEASYDPGVLLLDGPNVKFTSAEQMFSRISIGKRSDIFCVGLEENSKRAFVAEFSKLPKERISIHQMKYVEDRQGILLKHEMTKDEIASALLKHKKFSKLSPDQIKQAPFTVLQKRCFLELAVAPDLNKNGKGLADSALLAYVGSLVGLHLLNPFSASETFSPYIRQMIHLPGLRGNPARTYPVAGVGETFSGTFENYTASVISQWQKVKNDDKLQALNKDLIRLGLTSRVSAIPINDTQVELHVGRLARAGRKGARDLVNIADVGFGVSQTLPVLVALLAAKPGQLVYLEQPEIHLHPRAQTAMAQVLANAANRGVRVVVETHSSLLLLGIQTLVAEEKLSPDLVKFHWFTRREDGSTDINSVDLDEAGAFGDWPEDFAEVSLKAQSRYLDAAEAKLMESGNGSR